MRRFRACRSTARGKVFFEITTAYPLPGGIMTLKWALERWGELPPSPKATFGRRSRRGNMFKPPVWLVPYASWQVVLASLKGFETESGNRVLWHACAFSVDRSV